MIINYDRNPEYSLYYLGSEVLSLLSSNEKISIEDLYVFIKKKTKIDIHIDFLYYTLDWLYLISAIYIKNGVVHKCKSKSY